MTWWPKRELPCSPRKSIMLLNSFVGHLQCLECHCRTVMDVPRKNSFETSAVLVTDWHTWSQNAFNIPPNQSVTWFICSSREREWHLSPFLLIWLRFAQLNCARVDLIQWGIDVVFGFGVTRPTAISITGLKWSTASALSQPTSHWVDKWLVHNTSSRPKIHHLQSWT